MSQRKIFSQRSPSSVLVSLTQYVTLQSLIEVLIEEALTVQEDNEESAKVGFKEADDTKVQGDEHCQQG